MGFWSGLGNVLKNVGDGIAADAIAKRERINEWQVRYENTDDDVLLRRVKTASGEEKIAIAVLLRQRGYGGQN